MAFCIRDSHEMRRARAPAPSDVITTLGIIKLHLSYVFWGSRKWVAPRTSLIGRPARGSSVSPPSHLTISYMANKTLILCYVSAVIIRSESHYVILRYRVLGQQLLFQEKKQDVSTLWQAFSPGDVKNVPCCLNDLLVNFREESIGICRFCRLEVPTDGQLA